MDNIDQEKLNKKLWEVSSDGNLPLVEELISKGANINWQYKVRNEIFQNEFNFLFLNFQNLGIFLACK